MYTQCTIKVIEQFKTNKTIKASFKRINLHLYDAFSVILIDPKKSKMQDLALNRLPISIQ